MGNNGRLEAPASLPNPPLAKCRDPTIVVLLQDRSQPCW